MSLKIKNKGSKTDGQNEKENSIDNWNFINNSVVKVKALIR